MSDMAAAAAAPVTPVEDEVTERVGTMADEYARWTLQALDVTADPRERQQKMVAALLAFMADALLVANSVREPG
jgi:hypothetical protein